MRGSPVGSGLELPVPSVAVPAPRVGGRIRGSFHLGMALTISATAFVGFAFAYFGPLLNGRCPSVHVHDVRRHGSVHRVYRFGVPITLGLGVGAMLMVPTAAGEALRAGLAWVGRLLAPLYL